MSKAIGVSQQPMFLSLEGLSGVGKTVVGYRLASILGGELFRPTADFDKLLNLMTRPEDVDARMCLFLASMLYSSVRIEDRLDRGITVIVDGYIKRTIAYHLGMGARISVELGTAIRMPDCSVMLVCDESERKRRILARGRNRTIWDEIELANVERIRELYEGTDLPQVDTTCDSVEQIAKKILLICTCRQ
jgi:thymidylate kinase